MKSVDLSRVASVRLQIAVRAYQLLVAPLLPPSCRYLPSCSDYADRSGGPPRPAARLRLGDAAAGALPPLGRQRL